MPLRSRDYYGRGARKNEKVGGNEWLQAKTGFWTHKGSFGHEFIANATVCKRHV